MRPEYDVAHEEGYGNVNQQRNQKAALQHDRRNSVDASRSCRKKQMTDLHLTVQELAGEKKCQKIHGKIDQKQYVSVNNLLHIRICNLSAISYGISAVCGHRVRLLFPADNGIIACMRRKFCRKPAAHLRFFYGMPSE